MDSSGAPPGLPTLAVYTAGVSVLRRARRGSTAWVLAILGVYALLLAANPLLHHDVACHLKSPTHCVACTSSPSASRIEADAPLSALMLPEAGRVAGAERLAADTAATFETTGRSPPA